MGAYDEMKAIVDSVAKATAPPSVSGAAAAPTKTK
jgi:hypothetical protein